MNIGLVGNRNDVCACACMSTCVPVSLSLQVHVCTCFVCTSVCMCLRAYLCTHVSEHVHVCAHGCVHVYMRRCRCVHIIEHARARTYLCVCMCVYTSLCIHMCMSLSLYICFCMCMHNCMYTSMGCMCAHASDPDETNGRSLREQVWSQTGLGLSFSTGKRAARFKDEWTERPLSDVSLQSVLWVLKLTPVISFDSESKPKAEFIVHNILSF